MKILFVIWAGLIPLVPLIGVEIYKRRKDKKRKYICCGLFVAQILLSTAYITAYL